jgi:hypothetical protein
MGIPLDANGNIDFGRLAGTGSGPALGSTNTLPPGYDYNNPGRVPGMTGGECGCGVTFGPIIVADGTSPSVGKMLLDAIYDEVMRGGSGLDKLRQVLCEARC